MPKLFKPPFLRGRFIENLENYYLFLSKDQNVTFYTSFKIEKLSRITYLSLIPPPPPRALYLV